MLSRKGLGLSRAVLHLQSVVKYLHQPVPAERIWRDRARSLRQIMLNHLVIRLQSVVEYLHQPVPAESLASAASVADAPAGVAPGQVTEIESEEELDGILRADKRPTVLLAGFTWCRPCKVG